MEAVIRVWLRDAIPESFRRAARVPLPDEEDSVLTVFVAHVPAVLLVSDTYRRCNGLSGTNGWLPDGLGGFMGTNAVRSVPHPDGDGVLIIGSAV